MMIPLTNYQFSKAMQDEKLIGKDHLALVQINQPKLSHRFCLRLGNWLNGAGNWLIRQATYQDGPPQDLELVS